MVFNSIRALLLRLHDRGSRRRISDDQRRDPSPLDDCRLKFARTIASSYLARLTQRGPHRTLVVDTRNIDAIVAKKRQTRPDHFGGGEAARWRPVLQPYVPKYRVD